jgi:hypothetical protein
MSDSVKFGVAQHCRHGEEQAAFYAEITGGKITLPDNSLAMITP